ncbi:MFS transporter [Nocardia iowensis]|uniref:MFS transporter n=1 Tax=Nocardia iowensis TaxID=204891 RepID=A0ABX8RST2_NOCIO|nr:MFS transporter [Nocardia iowensis]QXN92684.1 MFS transporter [Nocardia iowensis]
MKADSTRRWLALGALSVAMLTIGLDVTVLTVALPTLAVDLNANTAALQWFSSAYTLALAAVMLPAGALGDRYGRKKFLLAALLVFGGASVACAFAASAGQLIAARVVLGVAAAAMMPLSMSVLPSLFPEPAARQRALTIWITSTAIGLPLGPIVGGWLLRNFWWGSVFLINVPMVIIGALAVLALVPESRSENRFRVDVPSVLLSVVGMLGLTYGFIRIGEHGWDNGPAWSAVAAGVLLLGVFVLWQRRTAHPLVDLTLFETTGFRWGTALSIIVNFAMFGMFFTAPQYFQAVLGVDALGSGLRLLPLIGGLVVGSRLVDLALPKLGARAMLGVGFALLAGALALGAMTTVDSGYGFTALWTTLLGAGMGLAMPTAMGLAMGELTAERSGSGSALIQALRQAGGTIGVAILGTVLSTRYRSELGSLNREPVSDGVNAGVAVAHELGDSTVLHQVQNAFVGGMAAMLWVCAILCALSAAVAVAFVRSKQPVEVSAAEARERLDVGPGTDTSESTHVS